MSRKIKFRAMGQTDSKWYKGLPVSLYTDVCHIKDERLNVWICDSHTVGQYIGIKDQNGKEIYEGDIVRNKQGEVYKVEYYTSVCRFVLQTKTGTWKGIEIDYGNLPVCSEIEVIGNVYENAYLLKERAME